MELLVGLDLGPGKKSRDPARETTMTTACAGCITSLILNKNRLCGRSLIVFLGSLFMSFLTVSDSLLFDYI
jgi:hypothetical protein